MKKLVSALLVTVCLLAALVPVLGASAAATPTPTATPSPDVRSNDKVKVDATYASNGYVMVTYTATTTAKVKVIVIGPTKVQYQYNLDNTGKTEIFPLSDGDGKYTVGVYTNTSGNKYAATYSTDVTVTLKDQFAPFLVTNQYVSYTDTSKTIEKAAELVKNKTTDMEKITAIYEYIVVTFTYDRDKAANVQSGYLPDIDTILAAKKGICFDYAAVMTAMLRSQKIPCKLVVGYAKDANRNDVYHAWINAYTKEQGWIDNLIQFDGTKWSLMDPTYISSARNSQGVVSSTAIALVGDGTNYSAKYYY